MTTYNADLPLPLDHVPKEDLYDDLLDVHNSLELLAQRLYKHIVTVDSDYTAVIDDYTILLDTSTRTVEVTLPDADKVVSGKRYEVKVIDATFTGSLVADSIDGSGSSITLTFPDSITVVSDNTGWWIV